MPTTGPDQRLERLRTAVTYYTDLGLAPIRINYPMKLPVTTKLGACSCGSPYRLDENGKPEDAKGLCPCPGKHPTVKDWVDADPDPISEWDKPWNIGLLCGPKRGLLVLDIDVRNGGTETYSMLVPLLTAEDGPGKGWSAENLQTFSYFTSGHNGSRGYHLLFFVEDSAWKELLNAPKTLHGIDIKSAGMVVAAPSLHASGDTYEIRPDISNLQSLDDALTERLAFAIRELKKGFAGDEVSDMESRTSKIQLMLDIATGAQVVSWGPGEKHDNLKPLIGAFLQHLLAEWDGMSNRLLLEQLLAKAEETHEAPLPILRMAQGWNFAVCNPAWSDQELQTMVASFWRSHLEHQIEAIDGVRSMARKSQATQTQIESQESEPRVAAPEDPRMSAQDYLTARFSSEANG